MRRRIALRAGLRAPKEMSRVQANCAARSTASALRRIEGWAQNVDHPEAPVCLEHLRRRPADRSGPGQQISQRSRIRRPRQRPPQLRVHAAGGARLYPRCCGSPALARWCPGAASRAGARGRVKQSSTIPRTPRHLLPGRGRNMNARGSSPGRWCFQDGGLRLYGCRRNHRFIR